MNPEHFDATRSESISKLREMFDTKVAKAQAEEALMETMERETEAGEILMLTDEEERLLRSFRRFKSTVTQPRSLFKWRTSPDEGIVEPAETAIVRDPAEAS